MSKQVLSLLVAGMRTSDRCLWTKRHNVSLLGRNVRFLSTDDADMFGKLQPEFIERPRSTKRSGRLSGENVTDLKHEAAFKDFRPSKARENFVSLENTITDKSNKRYANTFGNLELNESRNDSIPVELEDEDDIGEVTERPLGFRRRRDIYWERQLKRLMKKGMVKEAIAMFEVDMLQERKINPNAFMLAVVITACSKVGYTEKAFSFYQQLKRRGLKPDDHVFTALFNACALSPFSEDGLDRAKRLREELFEKQIIPNQKTYHAMIKAFALRKDMVTAFQIVDEMLKVGMKPNIETYGHLLLACLRQPDDGFKYAIQVWMKMKHSGIKPDAHLFHILLGVVRLCGLGNVTSISELVDVQTFEQRQLPSESTKKLLTLKPAVKISETQKAVAQNGRSSEKLVSESLSPDDFAFSANTSVDSSSAVVTSKAKNSLLYEWWEDRKTLGVRLPNILSLRKKDADNIVQLGQVKTVQDRLALIGDSDGVLAYMRKLKIKPNATTFLKLLEVIPSTYDRETVLIAQMKDHGVTPDLDFFNMLIKKRNFRRDYVGAVEVLSLLPENGVYPDIKTFGVLALGCLTEERGLRLLDDIEKAGLYPNMVIMSCLFRNAIYENDFYYLLELCKKMDELNFKPDEYILRLIDKAWKDAKAALVKLERNEKVLARFKKPKFKQAFNSFKYFYVDWMKKTEADVGRHPWADYKHEGKCITTADGNLKDDVKTALTT